MAYDFLETIQSLHPSFQYYAISLIFDFLRSGKPEVTSQTWRGSELLCDRPMREAFSILVGCDRASINEIWPQMPGLTADRIARMLEIEAEDLSDEEGGYEEDEECWDA